MYNVRGLPNSHLISHWIKNNVTKKKKSQKKKVEDLKSEENASDQSPLPYDKVEKIKIPDAVRKYVKKMAYIAPTKVEKWLVEDFLKKGNTFINYYGVAYWFRHEYDKRKNRYLAPYRWVHKYLLEPYEKRRRQKWNARYNKLSPINGPKDPALARKLCSYAESFKSYMLKYKMG